MINNAVFVEADAAGELMFYGRGAGGDPTAYEIRGALIALRREQQRWVRIRPSREQAA